VVNLRHDVRDILLCATLGAPFLVTYDHWGVAGFATHPGRPPRDDRPEVENHLQLLAETLNVPPAVAPKLPTASRPTEPSPWDSWPADAPRLLFHAAARTAAKLWPVAHWRELARRCADAGWPAIALLGSVDDRALNQQIATGLPNVADWSGRFSLPELATVLGGADLVIGVDSGPGHLAHAVGTRVVSLMSGTNCATRWAPDPAATLCHTVPCAPCRLTRCPVSGHPCLREITPDRVLAAMPRGAAA
jgi:ADP-heptose:LPS heptosyltransferase